MSDSSEDCFALMQTLIAYRHQPISAQLREIRKKHSMLHEDVLLIIHHLSKTAQGNILEIGPYLGGSTIAAGLGIIESQQRRKILTVEPGGRYDHQRLPSKDILRDLKRTSLAREFRSWSRSSPATREASRWCLPSMPLYLPEALASAFSTRTVALTAIFISTVTYSRRSAGW